MAFPIVYPAADGQGRLTEICTFRRADLPEEEFDAIYRGIQKEVATFPIARQSILGAQTDDRQIVAMVADWTSAEEKDVFEPGERYQSVKPAFARIVDSRNPQFACHHLVLPAAAAATPASPFYVFLHAAVPVADQPAAAAAFADFLASPSAAAAIDSLAVAPSREDAGALVCIAGLKDEASVHAFQSSDDYQRLLAALRKLATAHSTYTVEQKLVLSF